MSFPFPADGVTRFHAGMNDKRAVNGDMVITDFIHTDLALYPIQALYSISFLYFSLIPYGPVGRNRSLFSSSPKVIPIR